MSQPPPDGDRDAVQGVSLSKEPLVSEKPAGVRLSKSQVPGDAAEPVSLAKEMTTPNVPLQVVSGAEAAQIGAVPPVGTQMNTQASGSTPTARAGSTSKPDQPDRKVRIGLALAAVVVAAGIIWLITSGSKTDQTSSIPPAPSASTVAPNVIPSTTPTAVSTNPTPGTTEPPVNQFPVGKQVLAGEYIVQVIFDSNAPVPSWLGLTNKGGVYTSAFLPVISAYGRGAFNTGGLKLVSGGTSFTETDSNGQTYSGGFGS